MNCNPTLTTFNTRICSKFVLAVATFAVLVFYTVQLYIYFVVIGGLHNDNTLMTDYWWQEEGVIQNFGVINGLDHK